MTDYYRSHYQVYHSKTFHLDPGSFLAPLVASVPDGACLLDVGCGSGRDLLWLKRRGYQVTGLERAPELAAMAERAAGCRIIQADFETFDFSVIRVDAILLVGALVHLPRQRLPRVLASILKALRPRGWVLLTLKQGTGKISDDSGRTFYLWEPEQLKPIFAPLGLLLKSYFNQPSITAAADSWLTFLLERPAAS